jgi:hypothetical protein
MSSFQYNNFIKLLGTGINTKKKSINNTYKPGSSGVGASSISNRRAKNRFATVVGDQSANQFLVFNTLGRYNKYTKITNTLLTSSIPSAPILNTTTRKSNNNLELNLTLGFNGGSLVTDIEYSTNNGYTWTSSGKASSPIVISGLSTSISYPVRIRSINKNGHSDNSNAIQTPVLPSAPTINSVIVGDRKLTLNFTLGSDGGSPITDIDYSINGNTNWLSSGERTSPIIINNLTNDITYTVAIRATNAIGPSTYSNTVSGSPNVTIESFKTSTPTTLSRSWTAPANILSVEYLVVGGGGASGIVDSYGASGGGGGGMVLSNFGISTYPVKPGKSYTIVVGSGGKNDSPSLPDKNGKPGLNSQFDTIIALGGGGGYRSTIEDGRGFGIGGIASTPPNTASKGGNGSGTGSTNNTVLSGGGGGSVGSGTKYVSDEDRGKGVGIPNSITGSNIEYGIGGGGNKSQLNGDGTTVSAGENNTGGGGNASKTGFDKRRGTDGGSGIVVLRYSFQNI